MPPAPITEGEWAGWYIWHARNENRFSDMLGNMYFRRHDDGSVETCMPTDGRHANGLGYLHGGFLMSFIDISLFAFIAPVLENSGAVTLSCAVDFLSAGIVGEPISATGEVLKESGKMVFVRGLMILGATTFCSFNGTMRKVPRPARKPA